MDQSNVKSTRQHQVAMAVRVVQYATHQMKHDQSIPRMTLKKNSILWEGYIELEADLDRQWYQQGEVIQVQVRIHNRSSRTIRKMRVSCVISYSFFQ